MEAYAKCSASLQRYIIDYRIEMTIWNISVVEKNYNLEEIITKDSKTRKGVESSKKAFPENSEYWDTSHVQKGRVLRKSLWKETKQVIITIVGHLDCLDKSQQHTNLNPFYLRSTAMARCLYFVLHFYQSHQNISSFRQDLPVCLAQPPLLYNTGYTQIGVILTLILSLKQAD